MEKETIKGIVAVIIGSCLGALIWIIFN